MKEESTHPLMFIDPVCIRKVTAHNKDLWFTYQFRTYYFCDERCRNMFARNPERYLHRIPSRHRGWFSH